MRAEASMNTGMKNGGAARLILVADEEDAIEVDTELAEPDPSDYAKTLVMPRVRIDSVAPAAFPTVPPPAPAPAPTTRARRSTTLAFVAGIAVGVGGILV